MDKLRGTKTYSHHRQASRPRGAEDLFDEVVGTQDNRKTPAPAAEHVFQNIDHGKSIGTDGEVGKSCVADTTKKRLSKRSLHTDTGWHSDESSRASSPGLFKDTFKSKPKKTKTTVQRKSGSPAAKKKVDRLKTKKMTIGNSPFEPFEPPPCDSTGRLAKTNMANKMEESMEEIEIMRRNPTGDCSTKWTCDHNAKESDKDCQPSLSLSASMYDETNESSKSTLKSRILQPWTPAGVLKKSFVKIRTPASGERKLKAKDMLEPVIPLSLPSPILPSPLGNAPGTEVIHGENEPRDGGSDSYTTVYTWTTAAGTATNTQMQTQTAMPETKHPISKTEKSTPISPTLVVKCVDQDRLKLHSTAIYPDADCGHLYLSPHVSPIRGSLGIAPDAIGNQTPATCTANVSPRGPRKVRSFSEAQRRRGHPKCSTMLFTSSVAEVEDSPLDISSIRAALADAMDLNRNDKAELKSQHGMQSPEILTSTPRGHGYRKFSCNLSALHEPLQEEELLPLQQSGRVINSMEIVAQTPSDRSPQTSVQNPCEQQDNIEDHDDDKESGIIIDSLPHLSKTPAVCHENVRSSMDKDANVQSCIEKDVQACMEKDVQSYMEKDADKENWDKLSSNNTSKRNQKQKIHEEKGKGLAMSKPKVTEMRKERLSQVIDTIYSLKDCSVTHDANKHSYSGDKKFCGAKQSLSNRVEPFSPRVPSTQLGEGRPRAPSTQLSGEHFESKAADKKSGITRHQKTSSKTKSTTSCRTQSVTSGRTQNITSGKKHSLSSGKMQNSSSSKTWNMSSKYFVDVDESGMEFTNLLAKFGILDSTQYEGCAIGKVCAKHWSKIGEEKKKKAKQRIPSSSADSGFLDMQDIPPDDIAILSWRASRQFQN